MKTHIPTKLRKALIAALFAVSSVAYNAQAEYNDDHNVGSNATNVITDTYLGADAVGYFDFEFYSGTSVLGETHYTHSLLGGDYYTRAVVTLGPSGKFEFNTLEAYLGCDPDYDIDTGSYIGGEGMGYYSTTWSNGNISVYDAVLEVTKTITANGSLSVNSGSRVTAGNSISAGDITINHAQMTADSITAVQGHTLWIPQADDTYTTGLFKLSNGAVVTANKEIRAQELLVNSSTVNASYCLKKNGHRKLDASK